MINFKNRQIQENGKVFLTEQGIIDSFFINPHIPLLSNELTTEVQRYNAWAKIFDFPKIENEMLIDHNLNQDTWLNKFEAVDLEKELLNKCETSEQTERVLYEFAEYKKRNMLMFLNFLNYFVNEMKEKNIFWGLGRGSSCASYVLFLMDLHSVDSLKYDLDLHEFLK